MNTKTIRIEKSEKNKLLNRNKIWKVNLVKGKKIGDGESQKEQKRWPKMKKKENVSVRKTRTVAKYVFFSVFCGFVRSGRLAEGAGAEMNN